VTISVILGASPITGGAVVKPSGWSSTAFSFKGVAMQDEAFNRFLLGRVANGRAVQTIKDYKRVIVPFNKWCGDQGLCMASIASDDVRLYVSGLRARGWAPGHVAIHVRNLRCYLRWLYMEGYAQVCLYDAVERPKKRTRKELPITDLEVKRLLDTCAGGSLMDVRDRAIILTLLDGGLRAGEFTRLTVANWCCEGDYSSLTVYASKTDQTRFVPLGRCTTGAIAKYVGARGTCGGSDKLFVSVRNGRPFCYYGLVKMLRKRAIAAGVDTRRVHPHIFRKAFATALLDNGADAERVRVLGGWESVEMLRVYAASDFARLKAVHKSASPVDCMLGGER
jgi:site-specific recombinase XerD